MLQTRLLLDLGEGRTDKHFHMKTPIIFIVDITSFCCIGLINEILEVVSFQSIKERFILLYIGS